ncbi:MAG: VPLPA-CTERM sorting domain-containing protein [Rhodobacteraceae bacterium]|nr:VPLPA-CTERM sorting domain-containing protein [Paracoccaceae bacterium]
MFLRSILGIGTCIALLGGAANAAVVGSAFVDVAQDQMVTDATREVDPEHSSPRSAVVDGAGEIAELDFSYGVGSSNGPASFRIDVAQGVASLSVVFENPLSGGPGFSVMPLLQMAPATTPAELFMTTLFLNKLSSYDLADVLLLSSILNSLFAEPDGGVPYADAIEVSGISIEGERYGENGIFGALLEQGILGALPESGPGGITEALGTEGSVESRRFGASGGVSLGIIAQSVGGGGGRGGFDNYGLDPTVSAPIPLPAGILLLPAALGGLVLVGRRRKRAA